MAVEVIGNVWRHGFGRYQLNSVVVYDPLTREAREHEWVAHGRGEYAWCEWMPYQQGQAAKTEEIAALAVAQIAALEKRVADLEARPVSQNKWVSQPKVREPGPADISGGSELRAPRPKGTS